MKKSIIVLIMLLSGCGYPPKNTPLPDYIVEWEKQKKDGTWKMPEDPKPSRSTHTLPFVGMPESELYSMWGPGGDSDYYHGSGISTTWYTRTMLGIVPGYKTGNPFYFQKYLIWMKDGKVIDFSIH